MLEETELLGTARFLRGTVTQAVRKGNQAGPHGSYRQFGSGRKRMFNPTSLVLNSTTVPRWVKHHVTCSQRAPSPSTLSMYGGPGQQRPAPAPWLQLGQRHPLLGTAREPHVLGKPPQLRRKEGATSPSQSGEHPQGKMGL